MKSESDCLALNLYASRYALGAMLQGRANFFMDDIKYYDVPIIILEMFDCKT